MQHVLFYYHHFHCVSMLQHISSLTQRISAVNTYPFIQRISTTATVCFFYTRYQCSYTIFSRTTYQFSYSTRVVTIFTTQTKSRFRLSTTPKHFTHSSDIYLRFQAHQWNNPNVIHVHLHIIILRTSHYVE